MKNIVLSLLCLSLTSCALTNRYIPYEHTWVAPPDALNVNYIKYKDTTEVHNACLNLGATLPDANSFALACTVRNVRENRCDVHLPPNPSEYLIIHELLHCAGWSHTIVKQ
jgi:hypothetical protein